MRIARFALWLAFAASLGLACGGITDTWEANAGHDGGGGTTGSGGTTGFGGMAGFGGTSGSGGTTGTGGTDGTGGIGGSGGTSGFPLMDASLDDVMSRGDTQIPPSDASTHDRTMNECSMTCTSDSECQATCGSFPTYCCDLPTGSCYVTPFFMCPSTILDSGSDGSMYGVGGR